VNFDTITESRHKEAVGEIRDVLRMAILRLVIPLYLVFIICDWFYAPEVQLQLILVRLLVLPLCCLTYFVLRFINSRAIGEFIALAFSFVNGLIILFMVLLTEGIRSPYYAGLNLVGVALLEHRTNRK